MFAFLKRRIYRNQFIIYTIALFFACLLVCIGLLTAVISNQINKSHQYSQRVFEAAEDTIALDENRIDNYFLQLYSSQQSVVLNDLERFLGSTAEEYVTARLTEVSTENTSQNFIENVKAFVQGSGYTLSEIGCLSEGSPAYGNVLTFLPNGVCSIQFQTPILNQSGDNISKGFPYTKKISSPLNPAITLGEMVFMLSTDKVFPPVPRGNAGSITAVSRSGEFNLTNDDEATRALAREVYKGDDNHGRISSSLLSHKSFTVFTSENHRYKLVSIVDIGDIAQANPMLIFLSVGGSLFIFAFITVLLALRMSYDARYLGQITSAIDAAKAGNFTKIATGRRHDEYEIIAEELNSMSDELNEYIEREFVLKLQQKDAHMKMMQQQIHPHFLYNTLEIIRSRALMNGDSDVADAVYNLGSMFRSVVKSEDVITVDQELDILSKYLHLMEFKYQNSLYYQLDVDPEVRSMLTVKFWMQPLIENFFVHGYDKENELNLVVLRGNIEDDILHFLIINNGQKIEEDRLPLVNLLFSKNSYTEEPDSGGSIGLRNVYLRLCHFYGNDLLGMRIFNNTEAGITIAIDITLGTSSFSNKPTETERADYVSSTNC